MSTLHGNPESMRQFAAVLAGFCSHTKDAIQRIQSVCRDIETEWNDENYRRFCEQFAPVVTSMLHSVDAMETELVTDVSKLADRYEELSRGG